MATKRNIKDVLTVEGQKLNNTTAQTSEADKSTNGTADKSLDATIAELKADLDAAKKKENTLQKQITSLKADVADQKSHIQKLERLELQSELAEVKQTALKLAEENSKLQAEIKSLKSPQKGSQPKASSLKVQDKKPEDRAFKNRDRSIYDRPIGYGDRRPEGQQNTETGDRQPNSSFKLWLD
jgi:chromosome segregation ATPase